MNRITETHFDGNYKYAKPLPSTVIDRRLEFELYEMKTLKRLEQIRGISYYEFLEYGGFEMEPETDDEIKAVAHFTYWVKKI